MDPSDMPAYYRPNSLLEVQLADDTVIRRFTVVRPMIPFTVAQVLVVREGPNGEEIILKVYDPRFMYNLRKETKGAWDPQLEARTAELRLLKPDPDVLTLPEPWEVETPEDHENYAWLQARLQYLNEVSAYKRLKSLQGEGIPKLLGHGALNPTCMRTDPQPRYIVPDVLLLEYIPNAVAVKEAHLSMLRPDLIRSLIKTVSMLHIFGVIHADAHDGNYLVSTTRAVIIDFGTATVRDRQSDEEWTALVNFWDDLGGCKFHIAAKLGVKSLDDYLMTIN